MTAAPTTNLETFTSGVAAKYRIALGLIAILSCIAYFSLSAVIEEEENSAAVVNLSGRQRMLSQRIVLLSRELLDAKDTKLFETYKSRLQQGIQLMEEAHDLLVHNDNELLSPAKSSPAITDVYFSHPHEVDRWVHRFLERAKAFSEIPDSELSRDDPNLNFLTHVAPGLLVSLDKAVASYEAQSREKVARILLVEKSVLGFTLLVLLLEAFFIFQPTVNQLRGKANELLRSRKRFRAIASSIGEGLIVTDCSLNILFINPSAQRLLGWTHTEAVESPLDNVVQEFAEPATANFSRTVMNSLSHLHDETRFIQRDGSTLPVSYAITQLYEEGEITGYIITFKDISERKRHEEQIKHMAYHDTLTNLPNRRLFTDRLKLELSRAKRDQSPLGIMFLDLDGFKNINDTLGHDTGDEVLQVVSQRIQSTVRECDTVARLGGDEFILLLAGLENKDCASSVATKIIESLKQPIHSNGAELFINTSIGISIYPLDGDCGDSLIAKADCAMYRVKNSGRDGYALCANLRANNDCALSCMGH
ncbi:diguanylate cyclase domain-containing protein [Pseudomonadota bacterium]